MLMSELAIMSFLFFRDSVVSLSYWESRSSWKLPWVLEPRLLLPVRDIFAVEALRRPRPAGEALCFREALDTGRDEERPCSPWLD